MRWVQSFCELFPIVYGCLTDKLKLRPAKKYFIEREAAFHLDELQRKFQSGTLDDDCVGNADKTHFIVNMDSGKALGLKRDE